LGGQAAYLWVVLTTAELDALRTRLATVRRKAAMMDVEAQFMFDRAVAMTAEAEDQRLALHVWLDLHGTRTNNRVPPARRS
jgi:hypothetical protein